MTGKPLILLDPFPRNQAMVYTEDTRKEMESIGRVVSHFGSRAPDDLVESLLPEVEIIIGQTAMGTSRLQRAPKLRAILNVKANWEANIDYGLAHQRGIHVLSAAPAMAPAVAEFCLGQAIALARGTLAGDTLFRQKQERYGIAGNTTAYSLFGASVGLIGFGNLGRSLIPLLRPFTKNIMVYDPWLSPSYLIAQDVVPTDLESLLSHSRFLFVLAGVTTENEGFLDRAKLELLPQDSSIILASRAEVVDFNAFCKLAGKGRFRAAIDVFPEEPVPINDAIRNLPHIHFTAHLAGGMEASYQRIRDMMLDDLRQIIQGHHPLQMQPAIPKQATLMRSR